MSGSCRRMPLFEDLKLGRKQEKRERKTIGIIYIQSLSIEMSQNAFLRDACPVTFTTTSSKMPSISTMRTPLGLINRNITRGKELTPKLRNKIYALAENSHDIPFIIRRYKISRGIICYIFDYQASRPKTNTSIPRPSTKKTYNHLDKRNLLRHAC
jgi:hypothetical protein